MKVGDMVRVKDQALRGTTQPGDGWHEFMGKIGIIIAEAKRLYVPAAKVMVGCDIAEFDLDELELL